MCEVTLPPARCQGCEQRAISGPERGSLHLPAKHGHLVAQHDGFDRRLGAVSAQEPEQLNDSDKGQVAEREGQVSSLAPGLHQRKSRVGCSDEIFGTHRLAEV